MDVMEMEPLDATVEAADAGADVVARADVETYYNRRSCRAVRVGPFSAPTRVRVRAYGVHVGNGNNTADLTLLLNGEGYGSAHDSNFNISNLQVLNHRILDAGQQVTFAINSINHLADEKYFGMEFWVSQA
jgi:hypothetical protein